MPIFKNVEFRTPDYEGFENSLFQIAKNEFPQWTDVLESNQGVVFVDWLAFIGMNLCFLQNFHARQAFVPTVTEAKNLAKLAKQYDYKIPNNVAANVELRISNADGVPFPVTVVIPKGSQFLTTGADALIFETTADLTISAGSTFGDVAAKNFETKPINDVSDGSADFHMEGTYGPYIEGSMKVTVDGVSWGSVENFLDSTPTSLHYIVEVDSLGIPTVIFGDGVNGKIPPINSVLEGTYQVGGGSAGNVSPGVITVVTSTFYDVNNNPVDILVTNLTASEGGEDRESIAETKLRLPLSLASKEITIDYEDFENNITRVAGVARAKPWTVNDDPNVPENTVYVFVLPVVSDVLTPALEAEILAEMEKNPRPLTQSMYLIGPQFVTIDLNIQDLVIEAEDNDGSGVKANASITIDNNSFDAGDAVTVNGVTFTQGVDWIPGGNADASAVNLANAINTSNDPLLQDVEAEATSGGVVIVRARTVGEHGNAYTLTETDGATDNFTLSGATFEDGEDSTVQAAIREAVDNFFGRTTLDEEGKYTIGFGQTVYVNRLIWVIENVDGVEDFELVTPVDNVLLDANEFPKYTLKFTTS